MGESLQPERVEQYLSVLNVRRRSPSLDALRELVLAHLTRIPFENISKLYRLKHQGLKELPPAGAYLEGIARYHFGGTCYPNNFYFYSLLTSLGYEARLCAADMKEPGVHLAIVVLIEGREYLIDVGYAAPLSEPLPRFLSSDHVIELGRDRYVLRPQDSNRCSRLDLFRDGVLRHGYLVRPAARKLGDFHRVIAESFLPSATFLNAVLLARFQPDASLVIHNLTLIESRGTTCRIYPLADCRELAAKAAEHFGMPQELVADAVSGLKELADAWT